MPKRQIATEIKVEGEKAFRQALQDAARESKVLGSELKMLSEEFGVTENKQDVLTRSSAALEAQLKSQRTVVSLLEKELAKTAEKYGANSRQAQNLQIKLNDAKTAMNKTLKEGSKLEKKMEDLREDTEKAGREFGGDFTEEMRKATREMKDAEREAFDLQSALESIKGMSGFQIGMDLAEGLGDLLQEAYQFVNDTREDRRNRILTGYAAEDAGLAGDAVQQEVTRVATITGDNEQAREGVGSLIRIEGITEDLLSAINDNLVGLDLKAPEMEYAQLAEGFLESVGTLQLSGAILEALEKSGYVESDIDRANAALASATSGADAAQIILTELAGGHYADFLRRYQTDNQQLIDAEASNQRVEQSAQNLAQSAEPFVTDVNNTVADILDATAAELDTIKNEGFGRFAGNVARNNLGSMWDFVTDTAERAQNLGNRWLEMIGWGEIFAPEEPLVWELDNSSGGSGVRNNKGGGGASFEVVDNISTEMQEIAEEASTSGAAIPANFAAGIEAATPAAVASAQSMVDQINGILNTVAVPNFGNLAQMIGGKINVSVQPADNVITLDGRTVGRMITPYVSSEQGRHVQRGR